MPTKVTNILFIGDGAVGKTALIEKFMHNRSPNEEYYETTLYKIHTLPPLEVNKEIYHAKLHDIAGQAELKILRKDIYKTIDVVVLCYDVTNLTTYNNIRFEWFADIDEYRKRPKILVATKIDLREERTKANFILISTKMGKSLQKQIKAVRFLECSAITGENVTEVVHTAVLAANNKLKKESLCSIL